MNSEAKIKKFLKIKVAQYYYLIVERQQNYLVLPYKASFYGSFKGLGANAGCIALCSWQRRDIEFNMKKVMWNSENLPGLEALVIHEICHIPYGQETKLHGPAFERLYARYAGELAPAIDTLRM